MISAREQGALRTSEPIPCTMRDDRTTRVSTHDIFRGWLVRAAAMLRDPGSDACTVRAACRPEITVWQDGGLRSSQWKREQRGVVPRRWQEDGIEGHVAMRAEREQGKSRVLNVSKRGFER